MKPRTALNGSSDGISDLQIRKDSHFNDKMYNKMNEWSTWSEQDKNCEFLSCSSMMYKNVIKAQKTQFCMELE